MRVFYVSKINFFLYFWDPNNNWYPGFISIRPPPPWPDIFLTNPTKLFFKLPVLKRETFAFNEGLFVLKISSMFIDSLVTNRKCTTISIFKKKSNFWENYNIWVKISIFEKNSLFDQNLNFRPKLRFFTKFQFLTKISIFD